jgi:hypothetical protein
MGFARRALQVRFRSAGLRGLQSEGLAIRVLSSKTDKTAAGLGRSKTGGQRQDIGAPEAAR